MPPQTRQRFLPLLRERPFGKSELLLRQGDLPQQLSIVKVGSIMMSRNGPDGRARPVGIFGSGQVLSSLALRNKTSLLTSEAITPGRLCEIDIAPLLQDEVLDADLWRQLNDSRARSYENMADWAQVTRVRGTVEQVAAALLQLGKTHRSRLVRLPSHAVLASLLGTTRETIARALARLLAQGCITRRDRWHCELHEEQLVARIAASS